MSLATRCTSCGTVFRVVQDQLKVSEGWVRCGRCDAVFNALEGLFDLERDIPPEWTPIAVHGDATTSASASSTPARESFAIEATSDVEHLGPTELEVAYPPGRVSEADGPSAAHEPTSGPSPIGSVETEGSALDVRIERYEDPAPAFLREAPRPSRRKSAGVRIMMTAAAFVLLLGLAGQAVHQFRDLLAARMPALRPALNAWCIAASCSIEAVRRIEEVAVESSALTRIQGLDAFRLAVTLRNRGTMVIALPSIELSLTDSTGTVLARRSFSPGEFRGASHRMLAGSESALQVTLATGNPNISGYTVEIFYP
jgi:predicted Zn finger-like uncharacterized protein